MLITRGISKAFIFLVLVFSPTYSFSDVNKIGLICQCQKCYVDKRERGYWFENGVVTKRFFSEDNDKIISINDDGSYFTTQPDQILWYQGFQYKLNRKNLIMETFANLELVTRSICEVFDKNDFEYLWENLKFNHQEKYDEKLRGNKI